MKETRFVFNVFTVAAEKAVETLSFLLDEDIATIVDEYLSVVKVNFECYINSLCNLDCHSLEEITHLICHAYFDASTILSLMTAVINPVSYILLQCS